MKKNYGLFVGFIVIVIAIITVGIFYVFGNVGSKEYTFNKDGYALFVKENNNYKAESLSFTNGSVYTYKKSNNKIVFKSTNEGNVSIDDSTIVHYTDDSLLVLKNVVGLDLTSIDSELIFYYNIYKNTNINFDNGGYTITSLTGDKIKFNNMLIRITDNKYLFVSDSVRVAIGEDEVVDFGKYAYVEYSDGSIVGVYNNTKSYQSIGENLSIVSGEVTINLADKTISKKGEKYITLSNLVLDSDSNIDLIPQETGKLPTINKPSVDTNISGGEGNSVENNGSVGKPDNNVNEEVVEDENKVNKVPVYKVLNMVVTPIKIDAEIEIVDEDQLITAPTEITIVNNSTLEVVYESSVPVGDTSAFVSSANLSPDTEYTIYAKAGYSIDGVEYNRSFVNKIFRTEAIGVTFNKSYATSTSLVIDVVKENYSDVGNVDIILYTADGGRVDSTTVDFQNENQFEVVFEDLTKNTEYLVVMTNVMCEGVTVEEGYSEEKTMFTLKEAPLVSDLNFQINKRTSTFELSIGNVKDPDYGIVGYRYEVFRVDQNMNTELPLVTLESKGLKPVSVNVDEYNLNRGSAYTYRVIIEFNDNDKIIEYVKELGKTMQLDGVAFPTIRFEETYVTWEQINGAIIVEDESDTIVGDNFRVVYKNSVDVFTSKTITASTSEDVIPIAENGLRANETYTFQVYADINLKDGNPTIDEAYIGSVIVQTGLPNSLQASYSTNLDYGNVFSVNVKLSDYQGKDAKLEASTMTSMLVTLYQGSTAGGAEEAKMTVVDEYDEAYVSSIKADFYDSQFTITPDFFNLSNSDFTEKAYTMKISKVTDYTTHKNEIPIVNDTFSFSTNSYVPDVPSDEQAINVSTFLNKNSDYSGIPFDSNLDGNTVVGYQVSANYPNDANNAINMIYHVWIYNPTTEKYEMIPELDRVIPYDRTTGSVAPTLYTVGYGTTGTNADIDTLKRGNKFYFSYEVELDLDGDGKKEDLNYPAITGKDVVLKSQEIICSKQLPIYEMYPSVSASKTATWKYRIKDVDNAFETLNLHAYVGNGTNSVSSPEIEVNTEDFKTVTFNNLTSNNFYSLKSKLALIKGDPVRQYTLSSQYLSAISSSLNLTYTASVDSNTLAVSIDDYYDVQEIANKISSADVSISAFGKDTVNVTGIRLVDGTAYVNLVDYPQFINLDLTIGFKVYFDSGNTGFDVPSSRKALQVLNLEGNGNYFAIVSNKLEQSSIVFDSDFSGSFDPETHLLNITDRSGSNVVTEVELDERGVYFEGNPISFKELVQVDLNSDNKNVKFTLLVPSISLLNKDTNKLDITPLLTSAIFKIDLKMVDGVTVQDNLIHMELFTTDDKGLNPVWIKEYTFTPEMLKTPVTLENLNPQQNYMAKFYTNILDKDDGTYKKYYLYDADSKKLEETYNFHTLSNVGVGNIQASFVVDSYEQKKIRFTYSLENIIGYKYIKYELYELVDGEYVLMENLNIDDALAFNYNMSFEVATPPGNEHEFSYGKFYKLKIIPIGIYKLNGEDVETDLGSKEHEFMLDNYVEPQVSITGSRTEDSIVYRVNIKDSSKVISNDVYSVVFKELGTDGRILYEENNIAITGNTKKFEFEELDFELEKGMTYVLLVNYLVDLNNSKKDLVELSKSKTVNYGNNVSIGEVSTAKNPSNTYAIDIVFADSYLLNSVDTIVYSVTSSTIDYFSAGENAFTTKYNSEFHIYTHTIYVDQNTNFKPGNMYTVTMNFITEGEVVESAEVSYYYAPEIGGGE